MFLVIPLILFLNAYAMVPYNSIGNIPLSSAARAVQANCAVGHQKIVGDLPNMKEIIQLAKNAVDQLSSPPRIYATSGNSMSLWPDQPGAVDTSYATSGVQPPPREAFFSHGSSMTLETLVQPMDAGNYNVIFQSTWTEAGATRVHSWKFRVSANRQATFIGEDGDALPPLPM